MWMTTLDDKNRIAVAESEPTASGPECRVAPAPIDRRSLNLPNAITLSRLLLAIVLFAMIGVPGMWIPAAVLFVVAAATDFLDGYFARRYGQVTTLGRIMDPFVDKIIVGGAFLFLVGQQVALADERIVDSGVSPWIVLIVIGREMFVTSLRGFMEQHGIDFSADKTGKAKMLLQSVAVTVCLLSMAPPFTAGGFLMMRDVLLWVTALFTAYSGVAYFVRAMVALRPEASGGK